MTSLIEVKLTELIDETYRYYDFLSNSMTGPANTRLSMYDERLKTLLIAVEKASSKEKDISNIKEIVAKYGPELLKIHHVLVGEIDKLYRKQKLFQSYHDKMMASLGIANIKRRLYKLPTQLYEALVNGIFVFEGMGVSVPSYHREGSCGSKLVDMNVKFSSNSKLNDLVQCIIETMIYNEVYNKVLYRQDVGHLVELERLERLLERKEPGTRVAVKVDFNGARPMRVAITHYKKNAYDRNEVYVKNYRNGTTMCTRIMSDGTKYEKMQSFNKEEPWLKADVFSDRL